MVQLLMLPFLKFIGFATMEEGLKKLKHHEIGFLIKVGGPLYECLFSEGSPRR